MVILDSYHSNKSPFNAHTDPIFKELGLLKLSDVRLLELYSLKNSFLPRKFNSLFTFN